MNKHCQHISVSGYWAGERRQRRARSSTTGKVCEELAHLLRVSEQGSNDEEAAADGWVRDPGRGEALYETQRCELMVHSKNKLKEFHVVEEGRTNEQCLDKDDAFFAFLWYSS